MLIQQVYSESSALSGTAQNFLGELQEAFLPRKALIATGSGKEWHAVASSGLQEGKDWGEADLATGALEFAAEHKQSKIFADTVGPSSDNALAFLSGAPLDVVLVGHTALNEVEYLFYLSRSFSDGLYTDADLSDFDKLLSTFRAGL